MILPQDFFSTLINNDVNFFTGVPDSLLKDICAYITDNTTDNTHIIAANEGNAIALATGYHLATEKIPLVYMQNSGIGNAINPLLSLAAPEVYNIPMLLMIGWRGEPGIKDEPQHLKQGLVTPALLEAMSIPYFIVENDPGHSHRQLLEAIQAIKTSNAPFALLIKKGTFDKYQIKKSITSNYSLYREEAIKTILTMLNGDEIIVSTTGKTSRELFECRASFRQGHDGDFLTVGSMGHSSQIALGIALNKPHRQIICIDGDGALLMHMGGLAIIGSKQPKNYLHIVINNGSHESVGGQPTSAFEIHIPAIAKANKYKYVSSVSTIDDLKIQLKQILADKPFPALLEIMVQTGSRKDLGRPTIRPVDNKYNFIRNLRS